MTYNHSNMTYMQHEIRLTRKRLGIGKYGYLLIVSAVKTGTELLSKEDSWEYEQAKGWAKSWIETNTK